MSIDSEQPQGAPEAPYSAAPLGEAPGEQSAQAAGRRQPPWIIIAVAIAVLLIALGVWLGAVLGKSSAVSNPTPSPTESTPAETEQPSDEPTTEAPTPSTPPTALVVPGCAQLNPPLQQINDATVNRSPGVQWHVGEVDFNEFPMVFGPSAQTALSAAEKQRACVYAYNLEAGEDLYVSVLTGAPRETLLAALKADGDFVETTTGPAKIYSWHQTNLEGHWGESYTAHMFIGDLWVASYGPTNPNGFLPDTIDALVAANPQLAR